MDTYPNITEDLSNIDSENFNKMRISFLESTIKEVKETLQNVYKDKSLDNEDSDWLKDHLRWLKNTLESELKQVVQEQTYLKSGMNPTYYYK